MTRKLPSIVTRFSGTLLLYGALTGCGPHPAGSSDEQLLVATGFRQPVLFYARVDPYEAGEKELNLLAGLSALGSITEVPKNVASKWEFKAQDGTFDGQYGAFPAGTRHIMSTTEVRSWTEEGVPKFAETITYTIEPTPRMAKIGMKNFGPFHVRLLAVNNPAVGHWEVAPLFVAPNGAAILPEYENMVGIIGAYGKPRRAELAENVQHAIQGLYNNQAAGIEELGILQRDRTDSMVAVSAKYHRAFYTNPMRFLGATLQQMVNYCAAVKTKKYGPWHVATKDEFAMLIQSTTGQSDRFIDTPDGQLLGDAGQRPVDRNVLFFVSGTVWNGADALRADQLPPTLDQPWVQGYRLFSDGSIAGSPVGPSPVASSAEFLAAPFLVGGPDTQGRVICAADAAT